MLARLLAQAPTCSCRTWRPAPRRGSGSPSAALRAQHPRLIVCDISGYGDRPARTATRRPTTC